MNGFEQDGMYGPRRGLPQHGPFPPGGAPRGRSGCSSCLVGCAVAAVVLIVAVGGLAFWGYSWFKNDILEDKPIPVNALAVTGDEIRPVADALEKISSGEEVELVLSAPQARYLFLAMAWNATHSTGGQWSAVRIADVNEMALKLLLEFPGDEEIKFAISAPFYDTGLYLNMRGLAQVQVVDGKPLSRFEHFSMGKYDFRGKDARLYGDIVMQELYAFPEVQAVLRKVRQLEIKRGKMSLKLVTRVPRHAH